MVLLLSDFLSAATVLLSLCFFSFLLFFRMLSLLFCHSALFLFCHHYSILFSLFSFFFVWCSGLRVPLSETRLTVYWRFRISRKCEISQYLHSPIYSEPVLSDVSHLISFRYSKVNRI